MTQHGFVHLARTAFLLLAMPLAAPAIAEGSLWRTHPDLNYRAAGLKAYTANKHEEAVQNFLESAKYADKGSQAMLAEMFWLGLGVDRDPALGYVWADLAAERGYPVLVAKREAYREQLDATQRARVEAIGASFYAEYGDDVAKKRLEKILRAARGNVGSRVGGPSNAVAMEVSGFDGLAAGGGFMGRIDSQVFNTKYWNPTQYWAAQDRAWHSVEPPQGTVEVLPVVPAP